MQQENTSKPAGSLMYLMLLTVVAALGGLLFGYDTAVISGAVGFLQAHFQLGAGLKGWAASSALIGCIVGAMFGGPLSDRFGRKKILLLCAMLFAFSGIASALPRTLTQFVWARFAGGFAIGAVSVLSPLYIAEIAPEKIRGRLVSLYQLAIVVGILVVFFVNMLIQRMGNEAWNIAYGWRWMMGSLTLPSALFGFLLIPIPESPRWLMKMGRRSEAEMILVRVGGQTTADKEMKQIEDSLNQEEGKFSELLTGGYRRALIIGVVLAVVCQFSGINSIMYYAPEIFKSIGAGRDAAFTQTVSIGVVNLFFTFIAIWLVDRAGRKALLIIGSIVQVVALVAVGIMFAKGVGGLWLLFFIVLFTGAFAAAMGPIPWIIISEIFPTKIRGQAMSVATLVLWASCYIVSQTFPMLVAAIGNAKTFWIYALCSFAGLIFVVTMVPETKGKTLEEIEQSWMKRL
ncbi:MAG: sugar porter family MFS transporter [Kiritimatiellae bacterium]|nr:sugar porter family MFS transporter [Kiritimatiellia bacterium]MDD5522995.1 sugar porter family MFS transporter [Kiritimatiellia bacterium]